MNQLMGSGLGRRAQQYRVVVFFVTLSISALIVYKFFLTILPYFEMIGAIISIDDTYYTLLALDIIDFVIALMGMVFVGMVGHRSLRERSTELARKFKTRIILFALTLLAFTIGDLIFNVSRIPYWKPSFQYVVLYWMIPVGYLGSIVYINRYIRDNDGENELDPLPEPAVESAPEQAQVTSSYDTQKDGAYYAGPQPVAPPQPDPYTPYPPSESRVDVSANANALYSQFCNNCGTKLDVGTQYCSTCGQAIV